MRYLKSLIFGAFALAAVSPANAALILDKTGSVSELGSIWTPGVFNVDYLGFYGPQSYGPPPSIYYPPVLVGDPADGIPAAPFTYTGPLTHYRIELTTPEPLVNGQVNPITAWDEEFYWEYQGKWGWSGYGAGDGGGSFDRGCAWDGCFAGIQVGNKTIFDFNAQPISWWLGNYDEYDAHYFWLNDIEIMGDLPASAEAGTYRIQVFASAVPEPATWGLMLVGFAAIGAMVRRRATRLS